MEENKYDREQLLKEAMLQEGVTIRCLMQALELEEQEIFSRLYRKGASAHIRRVCRMLHIDPSYFSGGMRYENGKLVSS